MKALRNTREFVAALRNEDEILDITEAVDPNLELAEIQRRVVAKRGKAVLFHDVKGTPFPVVTNLYGSQKRIEIAFSQKPEKFIRDAVQFAETFFPPTFQKIWDAKKLLLPFLKMGRRKTHTPPILEQECSKAGLSTLPQIKSWPEDGGAFVLLPLVYTQSPCSGKSNLGMYRVQLFNHNECGMHIQIHRGGGFHFHEAETRRQNLPVHIYVGGPPALTIAAILPLPENVPEIIFASLLMGKKLRYSERQDLSTLPILANADFCIIGDIVAGQRKPEGPFGDHYGYYSLKHDYPFVKVRSVHHQKNAIYPATIVGRPPQEDHFIACYLQELLKPLIHFTLPQVKDIWAFEESGVHSLAAAIVKDRYPREALTTALRILGEGQLSLTKVLVVTDQDGDVKNFKTLLPRVLERMDFARDLIILGTTSQDTLDYTTRTINEGSKSIWLGVGEIKRTLPQNLNSVSQNPALTGVQVFCPGALVVGGPHFAADPSFSEVVAADSAFAKWPLVFLVDDVNAATASPEDFIWHTFTRFEPAADIHAHAVTFKRYHAELTPPIVIDCRLKPWMPKVLESDPDVVKKLKPLLEKYDLWNV